MGLFDRLRIEDGLDVTLTGFDGDPTAVTWQMKSFYPPGMENYKLTMAGQLYNERTRTEEVSSLQMVMKRSCPNPTNSDHRAQQLVLEGAGTAFLFGQHISTIEV